METSRRTLLKWSLLLTGYLFTSPIKKVFANIPLKKYPDLIAIKDGSPAQMFDAGIAAMGGMKRFVKPGQSVLVKPNIGWNPTPEDGANTQPDLVGKIIEHCKTAGASKIVVFDNTCNTMSSCYENSGIKKAVEKAGGTMLPSDNEKYYVEKDIPGGKILKKAKVHKAFLESDVVINVPTLKHHSSTKMTASLKNFMGVIWDRQFWHKHGLNQAIADFPLLRNADLTVIDAYLVMTKNGPRGISTDDVLLKKMQIISTDAVLADTAACKILNLNTSEVAYLKLAEDLKLGTTDIKNSNIKKIYINTKA